MPVLPQLGSVSSIIITTTTTLLLLMYARHSLHTQLADSEVFIGGRRQVDSPVERLTGHVDVHIEVVIGRFTRYTWRPTTPTQQLVVLYDTSDW